MEDSSDTNSTQATAGPSRVLLWVAIITLVLGVLMLAFGLSFVGEANASRQWPTAEGTVDNVRITWDTLSTDPGVPDREYYYQVYYSYEVDGQPHSGNRFSLGDGSTASGRRWNSEEEAREAAFDAYTPSQAITVYYDPTDPASAVVSPGANTSTYIPLIFGAVLLLAGLVLGWLYLRQRA